MPSQGLGTGQHSVRERLESPHTRRTERRRKEVLRTEDRDSVVSSVLVLLVLESPPAHGEMRVGELPCGARLEHVLLRPDRTVQHTLIQLNDLAQPISLLKEKVKFFALFLLKI